MGIRLGVIGVGGLGYLQLDVYDELDEVDVVGAADVSADARDLFESEFGGPAYENYRHLLAEQDLDAVTIVTPHALHYEQAKAAMERGLDVLVEKPMVTDVRHAVELCDLAEGNDLVLQVGYQRHFHPGFQEVRRIIDSGRIGELHMVSCHLGQDWLRRHRDNWRTNPDFSGGGQLYDTGSHLLDALLWTTEGDPTSVVAQVDFVEPRIDVNSALAIRLDCDGDTVLANLGLTGNGVSLDPWEGFYYWGTRGRIAYANDQITVAEKDAMTYTTEITTGADFRTLTVRKTRNFVDAIEGRARSKVPGEYGLTVTALTEAAYRAAADLEPVSVQGMIDEVRG